MGSQETNREMSQDLRLQAGVGVLNLQRRVEVEVEGTLLTAAAPTLLYSVLEGRKYQTRGILQLPPAAGAGPGLDWALVILYCTFICLTDIQVGGGGGGINTKYTVAHQSSLSHQV